ncbi:MAG: hypothetical protein KC435_04485 [Thermomicrobiales bacterium]|nr:hypothetical protein [Thermomicrobiales bacterium]
MKSKLIRTAGVAVIAAMFALPGFTTSAQIWDNDPTAYLYRTTCAEAANSRNATEISELENDRITLRRVWSEIGTGGDRPNSMWGEIDDIDHIGDVQTLISGDYAVVVHQDDSTRSPILACVDVEGTLNADGAIMLDLAQVDQSGTEGRVMIRPENRSRNEIEFVVGIWPAGSVAPVTEATPAG